MTALLKISLKAIILVFILVALNYLYSHVFYEQDVQEHSPIINQIRTAVRDSALIVYLGESSDNTFRGDDLDKRAISGFIADHFPGIPVSVVNKGALHAEIFKVLLQHIPDNSSIQTIILTLNLRSFNADWIYSELETPLQKSIILLKDRPSLLSRFIMAFKAYDVKTKEERIRQVKNRWKRDVFHLPYDLPYKNVIEWDSHVFRNGILNDDGTRNESLTALTAHYIKTYAFQIDPDKNPRIRDFDEIVEIARQKDWQLVFNLMAENTEQTESLVGEELLFMIRQNRDFLVNRYSGDNVIVVDNLEDVPDEEFIDRNWTTEHYAEKGRKIVAGNVADSLSRLFPNHYRQVNYNKYIRTSFYHDCEILEPWGQMQTLTDERAYSGSNSSKTGSGTDFSITFEQNLSSIPDSIMSNLMITMQVFLESPDPQAKIIIELMGEQYENFWYGIPIIELSQDTGNWQKIEYSMQLPDNAEDADLIKVYVYNPTASIIFIDDVSIEFQ